MAVAAKKVTPWFPAEASRAAIEVVPVTGPGATSAAPTAGLAASPISSRSGWAKSKRG